MANDYDPIDNVINAVFLWEGPWQNSWMTDQVRSAIKEVVRRCLSSQTNKEDTSTLKSQRLPENSPPMKITIQVTVENQP